MASKSASSQSSSARLRSTRELDDHGVLPSVGSVGDAYDNAMAEGLVDTFKTELIADRSWRSRTSMPRIDGGLERRMIVTCSPLVVLPLQYRRPF